MHKLWYLPLFALLVTLPACKNCCKKECKPVENKEKIAQVNNNENRSPETLALQESKKLNKEDYTAIQA